ncbi:hypothetical protein Rhopal_000261-T1 [Rhodotorula paludigena]|uniref:F-box domain-containing protein n=1 Tax=Rhodotorula paludigena TaxID=86838 RepID=A0AAV5GB50_9BASI|nr:hypothetical protein Rhopal_000261-T1 [Rhodotorula paludigena]
MDPQTPQLRESSRSVAATLPAELQRHILDWVVSDELFDHHQLVNLKALCLLNKHWLPVGRNGAFGGFERNPDKLLQSLVAHPHLYDYILEISTFSGHLAGARQLEILGGIVAACPHLRGMTIGFGSEHAEHIAGILLQGQDKIKLLDLKVEMTTELVDAVCSLDKLTRLALVGDFPEATYAPDFRLKELALHGKISNSKFQNLVGSSHDSLEYLHLPAPSGAFAVDLSDLHRLRQLDFEKHREPFPAPNWPLNQMIIFLGRTLRSAANLASLKPINFTRDRNGDAYWPDFLSCDDLIWESLPPSLEQLYLRQLTESLDPANIVSFLADRSLAPALKFLGLQDHASVWPAELKTEVAEAAAMRKGLEVFWAPEAKPEDECCVM